jgi:hypothetical protein
MRYSVISFPLRFGRPVSSDFRLLAYAIAWIRKTVCSEVYIIDTDTGDCVDHYLSDGICRADPGASPARCSAFGYGPRR